MSCNTYSVAAPAIFFLGGGQWRGAAQVTESQASFSFTPSHTSPVFTVWIGAATGGASEKWERPWPPSGAATAHTDKAIIHKGNYLLSNLRKLYQISNWLRSASLNQVLQVSWEHLGHMLIEIPSDQTAKWVLPVTALKHTHTQVFTVINTAPYNLQRKLKQQKSTLNYKKKKADQLI